MTYGEQLKVLLLGAGFASANVVVGFYPHSPDELICIRPTPGFDDDETHDGSVYEKPRAQILLRAADYETVWANAVAARKALRKRNFVVDGTFYLSIKPTAITYIGKDGQKPARHEASFQIQCVKEEES